MNNVLQLFLTLLFDSYRPILIVFRCLYILGAWMLLTKSGLKGFWALIPWAREYQLSRCASREPEGRVYCLISALITLLSVANICFRWNRGNVTLKNFTPLNHETYRIFYKRLYQFVDIIHYPTQCICNTFECLFGKTTVLTT